MKLKQTLTDVVLLTHMVYSRLVLECYKLQCELHYYGIPRSYVQEFCKTCPTCQLKAPQKSQAPLRPIVESEFLRRVQVDLIDLRNTPDGPYHYICHFVDHFTKYHVLFPLEDKTAEKVR